MHEQGTYRYLRAVLREFGALEKGAALWQQRLIRTSASLVALAQMHARQRQSRLRTQLMLTRTHAWSAALASMSARLAPSHCKQELLSLF